MPVRQVGSSAFLGPCEWIEASGPKAAQWGKLGESIVEAVSSVRLVSQL